MNLRLTFALALSVMLCACATYPDISQSRSPCRMQPGGWCAFVRSAAVEAYPYAIAATNAYVGDSDVFTDLGSNLRALQRLPISAEDADKGFRYEIFEQLSAGGNSQNSKPVARILAFRGTDFDGLTDIFYGSVRGDQIDLALRYFEAERGRPEFADGVPWVVTGHSLGGALATEISIRNPEVRAYMFNTSPLYEGEARVNDAQRMIFNERGEVLRRFARFDRDPAADVFTINCGPGRGVFSKHRIRPLADCIAWIAAYEDADALAVVTANDVPKPLVECGAGSKPHPGIGHVEQAPCIHRVRTED